MKLTVVCVAGALAVSGVATASAHGGATGIVKERMDAMDAMGKVMKLLSAMMRGETGYDAAAVREGAIILQSHSGDALTKLFPEGSDHDPSEAEPEIWSNWPEFVQYSDKLNLFAVALSEAAGNGLSNREGQSGMMGQGCMIARCSPGCRFKDYSG